jgi:hypothetical protein
MVRSFGTLVLGLHRGKLNAEQMIQKISNMAKDFFNSQRAVVIEQHSLRKTKRQK